MSVSGGREALAGASATAARPLCMTSPTSPEQAPGTPMSAGAPTSSTLTGMPSSRAASTALRSCSSFASSTK